MAGGLARQPRAVVWGRGELWPWPHVSSTSALQVLTCPNASFTDLAEIVSRIEPAKAAPVDGESGLRTHPAELRATLAVAPSNLWHSPQAALAARPSQQPPGLTTAVAQPLPLWGPTQPSPVPRRV